MSDKQKYHRDLEKILRAKLSEDSFALKDFEGPGDHVWANIEKEIKPRRRKLFYWFIPIGVLLIGTLALGLTSMKDPTSEQTQSNISVLVDSPVTKEAKPQNNSSLQVEKAPFFAEPSSVIVENANLPKQVAVSTTSTEIIDKIIIKKKSEDLGSSVLLTAPVDSEESVKIETYSPVVLENKLEETPIKPIDVVGNAIVSGVEETSNEAVRKLESQDIDKIRIEHQELSIALLSMLDMSVEMPEEKIEMSRVAISESPDVIDEGAIKIIIEGGVLYGSLQAKTNYNYVDESGAQQFEVAGSTVQGAHLRVSTPIAKKTTIGVGLRASNVHFDGNYNLNENYNATQDIPGSDAYVVNATLPTYAGDAEVSFALNRTSAQPTDNASIPIQLNLEHGVRLYNVSLHIERELWSSRLWNTSVGGSGGMTLRSSSIDTPRGQLSSQGSSFDGGTFDVLGLTSQANLSDNMFHIGLEAKASYRLSPQAEIGLQAGTVKYLSASVTDAPFDISLGDVSGGLFLRYQF